jgi:hypothetical protein
MYCNQCRLEVPDNYKFCPKCGAEITVEIKPQENNKKKFTKKDSYKPEKLKKKISTKKAIAIGVGVFFAFAIIMGQIFVYYPMGTHPTGMSTEYNFTQYKLGDYVWSNGINYQVLGTSYAGGDLLNPPPNGKYLVVHMIMTNLQNNPVDIYDSDFSLIDEKGNKYSSAKYLAQDTFLFTTIQPKLSTHGSIGFDIPANATSSNYFLEIDDENHIVKLSH